MTTETKRKLMITETDDLKQQLVDLLKRYAVVHLGEDKDDPDLHAAIRDALTDLRHVANERGEEWEALLAGADEVYEEEVAEGVPDEDGLHPNHCTSCGQWFRDEAFVRYYDKCRGCSEDPDC